MLDLLNLANKLLTKYILYILIHVHIQDVEKFGVQTLSVCRGGKSKIKVLCSERSINVS